MQINIITLGKLKEQYFRQACAEYVKRLSAFCNLNIIELTAERLPDNPSEKQIAIALEKEAVAISKNIKPNSYTFSLCIKGEHFSSEKLATSLENIALKGTDTVNFIIGSSFGLADSIKLSSEKRLSMSAMTFPHQLARVMLLEQVYRAFSIIKGNKYHK